VTTVTCSFETSPNKTLREKHGAGHGILCLPHQIAPMMTDA